jgi:mannosyltransferase
MATTTVLPPPVASSPVISKDTTSPIRIGLSVGLIALIALILRLYALTAKSFWLDEGISVEIARLPWNQLLFVLRHREANMALYYLLLRFWLFFGSSEGYIRGLSVLFSVATIPLLYALGSRLFGRVAGLLGAWLLAINAYHIRYAQEARGYAMVVFFSALAGWLLVRNLQEPVTAQWGAYAAAGALAVYSHLFGALVVIAHGASLAFLPRTDLPWRELKRSARWIVYITVPLILVIVTVGDGSMRWIQHPDLRVVVQFFVSIAGNDGYLLLLMESIAVAAAVYTFAKDRSRGIATGKRWAYIFVFAWLFIPVLLVLAVSLVRPIFLARYLNPCLPALMLIVAAGTLKLRSPVAVWILAAVISTLSLAGTVSYYRRDFDLDRDDWRAASSYVIEHSSAGDGVFFYQGFGRLPFEFYRSLRKPVSGWPAALVASNGSDWGYRDSLFSYTADMLQDAGPGSDRVWLVLDLDTVENGQPTPTSKIVRAVYGKGRHLIDEKRISNITILLFGRDTGGAGGTNGLSP